MGSKAEWMGQRKEISEIRKEIRKENNRYYASGTKERKKSENSQQEP